MPTQTGVFSFRIAATDADGDSAEKEFTLAVTKVLDIVELPSSPTIDVDAVWDAVPDSALNTF